MVLGSYIARGITSRRVDWVLAGPYTGQGVLSPFRCQLSLDLSTQTVQPRLISCTSIPRHRHPLLAPHPLRWDYYGWACFDAVLFPFG